MDLAGMEFTVKNKFSEFGVEDLSDEKPQRAGCGRLSARESDVVGFVSKPRDDYCWMWVWVGAGNAIWKLSGIIVHAPDFRLTLQTRTSVLHSNASIMLTGWDEIQEGAHGHAEMRTVSIRHYTLQQYNTTQHNTIQDHQHLQQTSINLDHYSLQSIAPIRQ